MLLVLVLVESQRCAPAASRAILPTDSAIEPQKYYACRLKQFKSVNLGMDIVLALSTSSAFAGLGIMKTPIGVNFFSILLCLSAVVSVLRPILKLSDGIDRYSKLHYAYAQLFLMIEDLQTQIRRTGGVRPEHLKASSDVFERYRNLVLQDDPGPSKRLLKKCQAEVNAQIPSESLWLPQE